MSEITITEPGRQCRVAGVSCFVKQLGSYPLLPRNVVLHPPRERRMKLRDKKGGDPAEWPEELRVREFPAVLDY